jgi:hypothetical protein
MVLVKEDGSGKPNANTYALVADADAFHEGHLYATAWTGASVANKEKALVLATRLIDASYDFNGGKTKATQALQWPRECAIDPDRLAFARFPPSSAPILRATKSRRSSSTRPAKWPAKS